MTKKVSLFKKALHFNFTADDELTNLLKYRLTLGEGEDPDIEQLIDEILEDEAIREEISFEIFPNHGILTSYGDIEIAVVKNTRYKWKMGLKEFPRHTVVVGETGQGKTAFTMPIILRIIVAGKTAWVFDSKKDYQGICNICSDAIILNKSNWGWNPLQPHQAITDLNAWSAHLVNAVLGVLGLSNIAARLLTTTIRELYQKYNSEKTKVYPCVLDIVQHLKSQKGNQQTRNAILERLESICDEVENLFSYSQGIPIEVLIKQPLIIFDFDGLLESTAEFITCTLLNSLYHHQKDNNIRGAEVSKIILIEEASSICSKEKERLAKGSWFIQRFFERAREFKIGVIACIQRPSIMTESLATDTKIMLPVRKYKEFLHISNDLGLNESQRLWARKMRLFQGIAFSGEFPEGPFPIEFSPINIDKTLVSNNYQLLAEFQKYYIKRSETTSATTEISSKTESPKHCYIPQNDSNAPVLTEDEHKVLETIFFASDLCSKSDVSSKLEIPESKITKIVKTLSQYRYINEWKRVKLNTQRGGLCDILLPTDLSAELLGKTLQLPGRGSIKHRKVVQSIANSLIRKGYQPRIELHIHNKALDIAFNKDGQLYAVEIEACLSSITQHAIENFTKDIAVGVQHVIFVALGKKECAKLKEVILSSIEAEQYSQVSFYTLAECYSDLWL